jgi:hypothetical protein
MMMNQTRSTTTLSTLTRCGIFTLLAGAALWSTGCAASAPRKWAQTSPTISPEPNGAAIVSLSAFESDSES